jgi:hypothetical protein
MLRPYPPDYDNAMQVIRLDGVQIQMDVREMGWDRLPADIRDQARC